ncbi:MAG TPA: SIR2 family protein [Steroidobacter sp.]
MDDYSPRRLPAAHRDFLASVISRIAHVSDVSLLNTAADPLAWLLNRPDPTPVKALLARPELVIPVIGAGISKPAGYPLGGELAEILKEIGRDAGLADEEIRQQDPRIIASILIRNGVARRGLLDKVSEIYSAAPTGTSETIAALLRVRSRRIVTFNYDLSLELRASDLKIECESLVLSRDGKRVREVLAADAPRDALIVIHAHGVATESETIVLDAEGYEDLFGSGHYSDVETLLCLGHRLIFLGTQLDEVHLLHRLLKSYSSGDRHLLVATSSVLEALTHAERSPLAPEFYGVLTGGYDNAARDHAELVPLVARLGEPPRPVEEGGAEGSAVLEVAEDPPDDYVPVVLAEKQDPSEDDLSASYLVAFGLRPPVRLEEIATAGTKTLIEGAPGAGKSTLLAEIGKRLPKEVIPISLRAPQLDLVGDPALLLGKWLASGEAFREGETAELARLETDLFHFLIDGLDEVPVSLQAQTVAQIVAVARANAMHSFTVASRLVPALEGFVRPEWIRVAVAPNGSWSTAYLARRGVTWEELLEASPLLGDLRTLLDLPYFLKHTVDAYQDGKLGGVGDLLELVGLFVDAALRRVDETLPAEAVRGWLRRLALAMVLAGKTNLDLAELAGSLPADLREFGDATAVAERLVSASLLRAGETGRYGFVHRLIGETLAAEALLEVDPATSRVLDVAAPMSSELVRGLRTDWLVPITLVATKSLAWRTALAERDPLAAARTVPAGASVEERRSAAQLIWDQYVEWRIWLSDRQRASIVDDEAVLARLISAGDLDDLQVGIREALRSDEREVVGNAIRVLAAVGDTSIEPELRRVLETTADSVLARFAASAVRDLCLDRLFYVIAHRAINSFESTEAQGTTYAAIDLARDEDLIAFARRAARANGEAIGILVHAIRGRVSAREELSVLRLCASHRRPEYALSSDRERVEELLGHLDLDEPDMAEDVLFVAAVWLIGSDVLRDLVGRQPQAAARALSSAVRAELVYPFQARWILEQTDLETLRAADAPQDLVDDRERLEQWQEESEG